MFHFLCFYALFCNISKSPYKPQLRTTSNINATRMSSAFIEFLGLSGGFVCTSSVIPQLVKCYQTRSTRDLSWSMFAINYVGLFMNVAYGISIHHPAVYITAAYSLCMSTTLVCMKWYYDTPNQSWQCYAADDGYDNPRTIIPLHATNRTSLESIPEE